MSALTLWFVLERPQLARSASNAVQHHTPVSRPWVGASNSRHKFTSPGFPAQGNVSKHVNLMTQLSETVSARNLMEVSMVRERTPCRGR